MMAKIQMKTPLVEMDGDECTRVRFIYGFEEHTPENTVKFFKMLQKVFPFKIQTIQTDNGSEFTYKYISETEKCPFDVALEKAGILHKLIPLNICTLGKLNAGNHRRKFYANPPLNQSTQDKHTQESPNNH